MISKLTNHAHCGNWTRASSATGKCSATILSGQLERRTPADAYGTTVSRTRVSSVQARCYAIVTIVPYCAARIWTRVIGSWVRIAVYWIEQYPEAHEAPVLPLHHTAFLFILVISFAYFYFSNFPLCINQVILPCIIILLYCEVFKCFYCLSNKKEVVCGESLPKMFW